ncbi:hypothetical protein [Alicyclobacillus sp.]|uniref:hypothetical protein n=1 Tax=Alicyclobacillus sp. TaxID=61169 RepID=UPI0025C5A5F5|nr:hypothetical protein [Alicyclobacillus sp.]MCL6516704.1 hypothetical protein [Alicyclobacillus sp.]
MVLPLVAAIPTAAWAQSPPGALPVSPAIAAAGAIAPLAPAASAQPQAVRHDGPVTVAGKTWRTVPYLTYGGTNYFGIWYLQQLLRAYGITSDWNGSRLTLPDFPRPVTAQVRLSGVTVPGVDTLWYQGQAYVDASALAAQVGGGVSDGGQAVSITLPVAQAEKVASQGTLTSGAAGPAGTVHAGVAPILPAPVHRDTAPTNPALSRRAAAVADPAPARHGATMVANPAEPRRAAAPHPATVPAPVDGFQPNGEVYVGGGLWRRVPVLYSGGTTFFGVWYFQQFLSAFGIHSNWDGSELAIDDLPLVTPHTAVQVNGGAAATTETVRFQGAVYVPAGVLADAGVPLTVEVTRDAGAGQPGAGPTGTGQDATGGQGVGSGADGTDGGAYGGSSENGAMSPRGVAGGGIAPWVTVHGRLVYDGPSYPLQQISVRDVQTHAHYYADIAQDGTFSLTLPPGDYEVFAGIAADDAIYLLQPFHVPSGAAGENLDVHLPALPAAGRVSGIHADVAAGDGQVRAMDLASVSDIFEHVYPAVSSTTGLTEQGRIQVTLYSSAQTYRQHFIQEGYSAEEADSLAENSVAAEEGTDQISVLMPEFSKADGLNVMAHELTHALVATVSRTIPSWANEGLAWEMGIAAELDGSVDPVLEGGIRWFNWSDTLTHQQSGDLKPLGQADALDATYNVELQDDWAMHQLIAQYGLPAVMRYVRALDHDPDAFSHTFGIPFDTFANRVQASIAQRAAQTDAGFTLRLAVAPNGPGMVVIATPQGRAYQLSGLTPGQSYDIVCHADGTVSAPGGIRVGAAGGMDAQDDMWFVMFQTNGSLPRQGFAIADAFGVPYVAEAVLYDASGQPAHAYPATALPGGLSVTSITPLR